MIGDVFSDGQRGSSDRCGDVSLCGCIDDRIARWIVVIDSIWDLECAVHRDRIPCNDCLDRGRTVSAFTDQPSVSNGQQPVVAISGRCAKSESSLVYAFMMCTIFGTFLIVPFIAPYLQANCGRSAADLPIIYAIAGICTLVSMMLSAGQLIALCSAFVFVLRRRCCRLDASHHELEMGLSANRRFGHNSVHGFSQRAHHPSSNDDAPRVGSQTAWVPL